MLKRMTIFSKIIILIVVLLLPVLLLYGRSNYVSVNVVEQTLKNANREQLSFFVNQVDAAIQRLSASANFLNKELDISPYRAEVQQTDLTDAEKNAFNEKLKQKLETQKLFASWDNELSIYFPGRKEVLSTNPSIKYEEPYSKNPLTPDWQVEEVTVNGYKEYAFAYNEVYPYMASGNVVDAQHMIKVRFYERNIRIALNQFKTDSIRDPFLFHPDYGVIGSSNMNTAITEKLAERFRHMKLETSGIVEQRVEGKTYLVTYIQSKQLGWYVVDYVALQQILSPILESRNYFYSCVAALILLSILAVYLLYRHVQVPIRELVQGVRRIEKGQYSNRMPLTTSSEFVFLFNSFNRMAAQIENLIESVLTEQIRSKEAVLKELQAQINPHFLFNCLAFIMSMAKTRQYEAILSMAYSLSKYYRYTTRSEKSFCKLGDEITFIRHYLDIQQMRMDRIRYQIDIQDSMQDLIIPRLLLQPLVENALIHGIEPEMDAGFIHITAERTGNVCQIRIEDDGAGMSEEEQQVLLKRINGPLLEDMGCGVWNVNQRLKLQFGKGANLQYEPSQYGGTCAVICLSSSEREEEQKRGEAYV
ncbi:sensor histidine kinase [Paenibacillus sp. FSL H8-0034]|uniref:sensor histidine kinase n=1 Tax=Paenibacillus sp. FSL H8-0034 TaxID=2954671 RepID=UPI0030F752F6